MGLNEYISMNAVQELQPRRNGAGEKKFEKATRSLVRQHASGVQLEEIGALTYRVLRMSTALDEMNGNTDAIKEQLGIRQYGAPPAQTSQEWYSTQPDQRNELPNTREALAIRDALSNERVQLRKCLKAEEADSDGKYFKTAEDLAELCDAIYPR